MPEETINTPDPTLPVEESTDGGGNDTPQKPIEGLAEYMNQAHGKNFKNDEEAAKGLGETLRWTGKAGKYEKAINAVMESQGFSNEDQAVNYLMEQSEEQKQQQPEKVEAKEEKPQETPDFVSKEQYEQDMFFSKNSQYDTKELKEVITSLRSPGQSLQEVVESETFKTLYNKAKSFDEQEASKSVLQSNSRLGVATDKQDEARNLIKQSREELQSGNYSGSQRAAQAASNAAVDSVIDSFEMGPKQE